MQTIHWLIPFTCQQKLSAWYVYTLYEAWRMRTERVKKERGKVREGNRYTNTDIFYPHATEGVLRHNGRTDKRGRITEFTKLIFLVPSQRRFVTFGSY